ncbi:MAG TPA: PHP domain-containing protein [Chloroflexota bacterium]
MRADLHAHTTHSDGTLRPRDVVALAAERGLQGVAIADHDSVDGLHEALQVAGCYRVEVVPAVELTAEWNGHVCHVLGYFVDPRHDGLRQALRRADELATRYRSHVVEEVRRLGLADALAGLDERSSAATLFLHLVRSGALHRLDRAGFRRLLMWLKHEPRPFTAARAIALIGQAGGAAVLAHPGLRRTKRLLPIAELQQLVEAGLAGIEVDHPAHGTETRVHYGAVADQLGLVKTGGSDYHGPNRRPGDLGVVTVSYAVVEALRARASRQRR